jgi:selenide,water dikinase
VLRHLPISADENLLSAAIPFADAGIYRLDGKTALVQSVDFFTPVVDDPRSFGRIAAANALSDLYAVGARPLTAMNLVGFPRCLEREALVEILLGGAEKLAEAGATLVGGHTVEDDEPKYGMAVTGLVDPARMLSTVGARPGDLLLLTKPLGTGLLATALKGEVLREADIDDAIAGMCQLNRSASEAMLAVGVHACTDITGFGLLGHALELAEASGVQLALEAGSLPAYPHAFEMAAIGLVPEGSYRNREYYQGRVANWAELDPSLVDLLADPQTSGGLLIAVAPEKVEALRQRLRASGCGDFLLGRVVEGTAGTMRVV